jgi:chorismate synthase
VDGCPPNLALSEEDIQPQLDRRRPGQSRITTDRNEADRVTVLSGVENGRTLGTPIGLLVANRDHIPTDYDAMRFVPRPSHAEYTYQMKYGIRASSGGGRSSARETIGRVAGGAIAEKVLKERYGTEIVAWVASVGAIEGGSVDMERIGRRDVDRNPVRCPDPAAAEAMEGHIAELKAAGDSIGGTVCCVCRNVPVGLGEPVFDKIEAKLAHAMLSLPATKGFEIGSGFAGTRMRGSVHNDPFVKGNGGLRTRTNHAGGTIGGITSGEAVFFKVAFKPPATIGMAQETVDFQGRPVVLEAKGRHDPCVVPRAVPIVEAMAALVLMDAVLRQAARVGRLAE